MNETFCSNHLFTDSIFQLSSTSCSDSSLALIIISGFVLLFLLTQVILDIFRWGRTHWCNKRSMLFVPSLKRSLKLCGGKRLPVYPCLLVCIFITHATRYLLIIFNIANFSNGLPLLLYCLELTFVVLIQNFLLLRRYLSTNRQIFRLARNLRRNRNNHAASNDLIIEEEEKRKHLSQIFSQENLRKGFYILATLNFTCGQIFSLVGLVLPPILPNNDQVVLIIFGLSTLWEISSIVFIVQIELNYSILVRIIENLNSIQKPNFSKTKTTVRRLQLIYLLNASLQVLTGCVILFVTRVWWIFYIKDFCQILFLAASRAVEFRAYRVKEENQQKKQNNLFQNQNQQQLFAASVQSSKHEVEEIIIPQLHIKPNIIVSNVVWKSFEGEDNDEKGTVVEFSNLVLNGGMESWNLSENEVRKELTESVIRYGNSRGSKEVTNEFTV